MAKRLALSPKQQNIVDACPPHLRAQLADVLETVPMYVATGHVPGSDGPSIAHFLAKQPAPLVAIFEQILEAAGTSRLAPFQPKASEAERIAQFGLDPAWQLVKDAVDTMGVMSKVQDRMGTDPAPSGPPTLRESLAASARLEEPMQRLAEQVDRELADAGRHTDMRTAIETSGNIEAENIGQSYEPEREQFTAEPGTIRDSLECSIAAHERVGGAA